MLGFGFNKDRARANAERFLQQNKLQNAIAEYEKIAQHDSRDLNVLNTIGDLYSRIGQTEQAIEKFRIVGEGYAADGFNLKAIAIYRKISKLAPGRLVELVKLGDLYRKQGLISDARSVLLQAADLQLKAGNEAEALQLLKSIIEIDPENVVVLTRAAELMSKAGSKTDAEALLTRAADTLCERKALDSAKKVLEHLIQLNANNVRALESLGMISVQLGDYAAAAEQLEGVADLDSRPAALKALVLAYIKSDRLQDAVITARKQVQVHRDPEGILSVTDRMFAQGDAVEALGLYGEFIEPLLSHDPDTVRTNLRSAVSRVKEDPESLETVYQLLMRAGENSQVPEVLELLANARVQRNDLEGAKEAYRELLQLEPDNESHAHAYRQVCERLGHDATIEAVEEPVKAAETIDELLDEAAPVLPLQAVDSEIEEKIQGALAEAEMCESYGAGMSAMPALRAALESAPQDLRLLRAVGRLHHKAGEVREAEQVWANMARILGELQEPEAAAYYSQRSGTSVVASTPAVFDISAEPQTFDLSPVSEPIEPSTEVASGSTEEIDLSDEWEQLWQQEMNKPTAPATAELSDLSEEIRFYLSQQMWAEAERAVARLEAAAPNYPELPAFRAEMSKRPAAEVAQPEPQAQVETAEPQEFEISRVPMNEAEALEAFGVVPAFDADELPGVEVISIEDVTDDPLVNASSSVVVEETAEEFSLASFSAELSDELGDALGSEAAKPSVPAPAPKLEVAPAVPQSLPAVIEEPVLEVPVASTPGMFDDLLQEVEDELRGSEAEEQEDPETHYNLGVAFKEMGLLDEAIGELQKVCKMVERGAKLSYTLQAYTWLAACLVEKGVPEASFKWYERALEMARDEEMRTAIHYELACAYEAAGKKRDALTHFMEVYGSNIDYRDVSSRIQMLRV